MPLTVTPPGAPFWPDARWPLLQETAGGVLCRLACWALGHTWTVSYLGGVGGAGVPLYEWCHCCGRLRTCAQAVPSLDGEEEPPHAANA